MRLWLRSQVSKIADLQFKLEGSDQQILTGTIPAISLSATGAIYKGLHLTQVNLTGTGIRINIGQVVKGKPLRLLDPVQIFGELRMTQTDFNASLQAPLFANAVSEFLLPLVQIENQRPVRFANLQVIITDDRLILNTTLVSEDGQPHPWQLDTGLGLTSNHELGFEQPEIKTSSAITSNLLDGFKVDLGSEVKLEELTLTTGLLVCRGRINVLPDPEINA